VDPECLSRIPGPDFSPRIPNPKEQNRGEKLVVINFFVAIKFTKLENYFLFEEVKENI
jgi:hypothetical protein